MLFSHPGEDVGFTFSPNCHGTNAKHFRFESDTLKKMFRSLADVFNSDSARQNGTITYTEPDCLDNTEPIQ